MLDRRRATGARRMRNGLLLVVVVYGRVMRRGMVVRLRDLLRVDVRLVVAQRARRHRRRAGRRVMGGHQRRRAVWLAFRVLQRPRRRYRLRNRIRRRVPERVRVAGVRRMRVLVVHGVRHLSEQRMLEVGLVRVHGRHVGVRVRQVRGRRSVQRRRLLRGGRRRRARGRADGRRGGRAGGGHRLRGDQRRAGRVIRRRLRQLGRVRDSAGRGAVQQLRRRVQTRRLERRGDARRRPVQLRGGGLLFDVLDRHAGHERRIRVGTGGRRMRVDGRQQESGAARGGQQRLRNRGARVAGHLHLLQRLQRIDGRRPLLLGRRLLFYLQILRLQLQRVHG